MSIRRIQNIQWIFLIFIIAGSTVLGESFRLLPSLSQMPGYPQWQSWLEWLRSALVGSLEAALPSPQAGLVEGVILGATENIRKKTVEDFRATGTSHMVAVSGYNVTIVAETASKLLVRLGLNRRQAFWAMLVLLVNFAVLTGAQSAVVRASIMSLIVLTARHIGRPSQISLSVMWAGLVMLLFNPLLWRNDMGFQLSFLSTLGLIYFSPWVEARLPLQLPDFLKSNIASTLSATLLTTPLIVYSFGRFSLAFLPANLLALPFIPWLMTFGAAAMFIGLLGQLAGQISGIAAHLIASYILGVLNYLAALPLSQIDLGKNNYLALGLYVPLLIFYWLVIRRATTRKIQHVQK